MAKALRPIEQREPDPAAEKVRRRKERKRARRLARALAGEFTRSRPAQAACDMAFRITMPYCPVSDSAKAKADSIPVTCLFDSLPVRP